MTPLHGIACFCDIGFGARAVSRKTPIYFIIVIIRSDSYLRRKVFLILVENRRNLVGSSRSPKKNQNENRAGPDPRNYPKMAKRLIFV